MLERLYQENYEEYLDFAYELALDRTKSSYPTYTDGLKTKEDFLRVAARAFEGDNEEVLLFREGERLLGWLHYYVLPEDRYVGLQNFLTAEGTGPGHGGNCGPLAGEIPRLQRLFWLSRGEHRGTGGLGIPGFPAGGGEPGGGVKV